MDLSELDKIIAARSERIDKRKVDGTLFEEEIAKTKVNDDDLEKGVQKQKEKMAQKTKSALPPCPQCGVKMSYVPEQSMIVCQTCGIGMRV